jgi:hypothetical protein
LGVNEQRKQGMAHQFHKSIITHRVREIVPHMNADISLVITLEIAVARVMKQDDDSHHFA